MCKMSHEFAHHFIALFISGGSYLYKGVTLLWNNYQQYNVLVEHQVFRILTEFAEQVMKSIPLEKN